MSNEKNEVEKYPLFRGFEMSKSKRKRSNFVVFSAEIDSGPPKMGLERHLFFSKKSRGGDGFFRYAVSHIDLTSHIWSIGCIIGSTGLFIRIT